MEQENYLWAEWSSQEFCQQMLTDITKKRTKICTEDSRKKMFGTSFGRS